jgi:hypothetical protein
MRKLLLLTVLTLASFAPASAHQTATVSAQPTATVDSNPAYTSLGGLLQPLYRGLEARISPRRRQLLKSHDDICCGVSGATGGPGSDSEHFRFRWRRADGAEIGVMRV